MSFNSPRVSAVAYRIDSIVGYCAVISIWGQMESRMSPDRSLPRVVLVLALLLAAPPAACAQSELQTWLNPELGKLMLRGQYAFTYYPNQPVERQSTGFRLLEHDGSILVPIYQDSRNEWTLSAGVGVQEIHTQAILPSTGERFPDELWDIQVGAAYRHKFDNGGSAGSVSRSAPPATSRSTASTRSSSRPWHSCACRTGRATHGSSA